MPRILGKVLILLGIDKRSFFMEQNTQTTRVNKTLIAVAGMIAGFLLGWVLMDILLGLFS